MATTATVPAAVAGLRARLDGPVLVDGDPGFRESFAPFNCGVEQTPAAVAVVDSVADVVHAVRWAAEQDLPVAVQSTGHGIGRPADGALLVVTSRLRRVRVDPVRRRAYVAAGNQWGDVLPLAQQHGLAPVLGSSPHVGCLGFVLGGGVGWLARQHGLGSDHVVSFDVVTPDGTLVHASDHDHAELFWALRGAGGGPFGVVVGMEISLHPLTRVYAGNLWYPAELAGDVTRRWLDWTASAPDELTSSVAWLSYPDVDGLPEQLRGRDLVAVRGLWCGAPDAGRALVDAWRSWRRPAVDGWTEQPFGDVGTVSHDPVDPMPALVTTDLFDRFDDATVDTAVGAWQDGLTGDRLVAVGEIRHFGGAVRRLGPASPNERTRDAEYCLEYIAVEGEPHRRHAVEEHFARTRERLAPATTGSVYLNFTEGAEKGARTPDAFGASAWQRLRALKTQLDPQHRFRHGFVVPPFDADGVPQPRQG